MDARSKYTAISRTTSKGFIILIDVNEKEIDVDFKSKVTQRYKNLYNRKRLEDPIVKKREEIHSILMQIICCPKCSDKFSIKHTLKSRKELLKYLGIENGIPKGYQIDNIRERKTCETESDFKCINYFNNLRLLPANDNLARNWMKK